MGRRTDMCGRPWVTPNYPALWLDLRRSAQKNAQCYLAGIAADVPDLVRRLIGFASLYYIIAVLASVPGLRYHWKKITPLLGSVYGSPTRNSIDPHNPR